MEKRANGGSSPVPPEKRTTTTTTTSTSTSTCTCTRARTSGKVGAKRIQSGTLYLLTLCLTAVSKTASVYPAPKSKADT
jgi:hypothetical protein